jgi:hypothetical protein
MGTEKAGRLWQIIHVLARVAGPWAARTRGCVQLAFLIAAFVGALGAPSAAIAETGRHSTVVRLWVQPPFAGYTLSLGESPTSSGQVHFGAISLGLELSEFVAVEAGGGVLLSPVGGEPGVSFDADAWGRVGLVPVVYRARPEKGWVLQFASMLGYRYMQRSKIVQEDYLVDTEHVHALALDVGPMATYRSAGGVGFAVRLLSGAILPIARTHSTLDSRARLHVAVPVGLDVGVAF